jgi:hypothetical protein
MFKVSGVVGGLFVLLLLVEERNMLLKVTLSKAIVWIN